MFPFQHQIRVSYRDVTIGNHVYYARYLDFLEIVRNEVFRKLGYSLLILQQQNLIFPVVECGLKFLSAARYDDLLDVHCCFSDVGRIQFTVEYEIRRGETLLVTASTRHASTNLEEKPIRMPAELIEAMKASMG
jgi:acyl-CoA thioester hydrolase